MSAPTSTPITTTPTPDDRLPTHLTWSTPTTTNPMPEEHSLSTHLTWSAPTISPPLSEDEIANLRKTLQLLHNLLAAKGHTTTKLSNNKHHSNDEDLINLATTLTTGNPPLERKRDKAKRFLKGNGPRIAGAATALALGILNIVTSVGC